MKKTIARISLCLSISALAAGCYETGDKTDCVGLSCPTGLLWPDGGEVRLQYIGLPDGSEMRFVVGFFIESQDPAFVQPPVLGQCFDDSNYVPETRVYADAGDSMTAHVGSFEIEAPKVMGDDAIDFIGRHHKLAYLMTTFEPTVDDFFDNYHSATTDKDIGLNGQMTGIYMPPRVEVLSPEPAGVRLVKAGEDLVVRWQEETPADPNINTAGIVIFWKTGAPGDINAELVACVGPNHGEFIVPKETIDALPDAGGIMQVGTASNQAILDDQERRIDLWASNCIAFPWMKY